MSAIDAVTNTSAYTSLLNASTAKRNKDMDFSAILAASMQPALPGLESENSQSQMMMEISMIQEMQKLVERLDSIVQKIEGTTEASTTNTGE